MATARASFFDVLRRSGLLEPGQIDELAALAPAQRGDASALARAVLQRGWLTRFQLAALAQGRGKELVVGPYRLLDQLGEGGMGRVYKAHHGPMDRTVALKLIRNELLANPNAVRRFYREVQAAARLSHPNIVTAYDAGQAGDTHYFAMEYVEGVDLARLVQQTGPLPVAQACDFVRQAALGLQHAFEQGMVHRDIKPHNLLVVTGGSLVSGGVVSGKDPGTSPHPSPLTPHPSPNHSSPLTTHQVKILDLGLARLQGPAEANQALTRDGAVMGTPEYLAPEQALDARAADVRSDLYGLGCTLYFLLAGRPPFQGGTLTEMLLNHQMGQAVPLPQVRADVPPGVDAVVTRLLAKRPEERYQTPAGLAEALAPFCGGGGVPVASPITARPATRPEALWASATEGMGEPPVRLGRGGADADGTLVEDEPDGARGRPAGKLRPVHWVLIGAGGAVAALAAVLAVVLGGREPDRPPVHPARGPDVAVARPGPAPKEPVVNPAPAGLPNLPDPLVKPPLPAPARPRRPRPALPGPGPEAVVKKQVRRPIPAAAEQAQAEKLVKELFEEGYAKKTAAGRLQLAAKLIDKAAETADDPTARFVLLREARDLAAEAGDPRTAFRAVEDMARHFVIDDKEMKAGALARAAESAATPAATRAVVDGYLALVEEAADEDDYDAALRLVEEAEAAARKADSVPLASRVKARAKELREVQKAFAAVKPARDALKTRPDDPEANLAVGKFLCFSKGDWERGLPLLARGSDQDLQALARKDLDEPAEPAAQVELGDAWWDRAQDAPGGARARLQDRAYQWYEQAAPGLAGLARARVENRMKQLDQLPGFSLPQAAGLVRTFDGHTGPVYGVAVSRDGRRAVSGGADGALRVWDVRTGKHVRTLEDAGGEIRAVALSPDGRRAVTGGTGGVWVWDLQDGRQVRNLATRKPFAGSVAFTSDGRSVLYSGEPGWVELWNLETDKFGWGVSNHGWGKIACAALSPDDKWFAVSGPQGMIQFFATGRGLTPPRGFPYASLPQSVVVAPNGRQLFGGCADGFIRAWDVNTGQVVGTFMGHGGPVTSVAVSRDGRRLVSGSTDHTVRVWDAKTHREIGLLEGHAGAVRSVAFLDGRRALSAGDDKTIRLWGLAK